MELSKADDSIIGSNAPSVFSTVKKQMDDSKQFFNGRKFNTSFQKNKKHANKPVTRNTSKNVTGPKDLKGPAINNGGSFFAFNDSDPKEIYS